MEGRGLLTAPALLYASEFPRISITRLSGNSERAAFRGPKSQHEGAKWHNFRRSALPRKARSDPFRYFPDSLSRQLVNRCKGSSYLPMPYVLEAPGAAR